MMTTPSKGGVQEALCLPLRLLNGWLFGIDERRVKRDEVRHKIVQYKRECYEVLFNHFMPQPVAARREPEAMADEWSRWLEIIREGRRVYGQRFARELWARPDCPLPKKAVVEVARDAGIRRFLRDLPGLPEGVAGEPWIGATDLYRVYCDWCAARGEDPASQTLFGRILVDAGAWREMKAGRMYYARSGLVVGAPQTMN